MRFRSIAGVGPFWLVVLSVLAGATASCGSPTQSVSSGTPEANNDQRPVANSTVTPATSSVPPATAAPSSKVLTPADHPGLSGYAFVHTIEGTGRLALEDNFRGTRQSVEDIPVGSCVSWMKIIPDYPMSVTELRSSGTNETVVETVWTAPTADAAESLFRAMREAVSMAAATPSECASSEGRPSVTFQPVNLNCPVGDECVTGEELPVELVNYQGSTFSKESGNRTYNHSWTAFARQASQVVVISIYSYSNQPPASAEDLARLAVEKL